MSKLSGPKSRAPTANAMTVGNTTLDSVAVPRPWESGSAGLSMSLSPLLSWATLPPRLWRRRGTATLIGEETTVRDISGRSARPCAEASRSGSTSNDRAMAGLEVTNKVAPCVRKGRPRDPLPMQTARAHRKSESTQ